MVPVTGTARNGLHGLPGRQLNPCNPVMHQDRANSLLRATRSGTAEWRNKSTSVPEADRQWYGEREMSADVVSRVRENPEFSKLIEKRNRYSWTLAILMLVIYYGFILLVAFDKQFLAIKIGATVTLAFPIGLGVILAAIIITGLYVLRANNVYDPMTRAIVEDAR